MNEYTDPNVAAVDFKCSDQQLNELFDTGSENGADPDVLHRLYCDILGIEKIDRLEKSVVLCFKDTTLEWCEGRVRVDGQTVFLSWRAFADEIVYKALVPKGYSLEIKNAGSKNIVDAG